VLQSSNKI